MGWDGVDEGCKEEEEGVGGTNGEGGEEGLGEGCGRGRRVGEEKRRNDSE